MIQIGHHSNVKYAEMDIVKIDQHGNRIHVATLRWHRNPLIRAWWAFQGFVSRSMAGFKNLLKGKFKW